MSYDVAVGSKQAAGPQTNQGAKDAPAAEVVLDAPVVIHLELGTVTGSVANGYTATLNVPV